MRKLSLSVMLLLLPVMAAASFTSSDVGGGGWLHSGTFHPTDPDIMLVGTDVVSGISRSDDGGQSWSVWNEGLPNYDETKSMYVEDLLGIEEPDGTVAYYAATHAGIYRREEMAGEWEWAADPNAAGSSDDHMLYWPENNDARRYHFVHRHPISFACLDDNGDGLIVAGAGRVRWHTNYETDYYPGYDWPLRQNIQGCNNNNWSIWVNDLNGSAGWLHLPSSQDLGTVRDITVVKNALGYNIIVAATTTGIYWFNYELGTMAELHDNMYVDMSGSYPYPELDYPGELTAWSVHATERGTIYVAMQKLGGDLPSGVYRMYDGVENNGMFWSWVGNFAAINPHSIGMWDIGQGDGIFGATDMIYMSVKDGVDEGYDEIYAGSRNNSFGMFKGWQPDKIVDAGGQLDLDNCFWTTCFTQTSWTYDTLFCYGNWDFGWENIWGVHILFHPVIFPGGGDYGNDRVLVQSSTRLHVSNAGGYGWDNSYCDGHTGNWSSKGYNEHCTKGIGFLSDGRVISSNTDTGSFLSTSDQLSAWQYIKPTYDYWSTPSDDMIAQYASNSVQVRSDWRGKGYDAIFMNYSSASRNGWYGKIFKARELSDGSFLWENITKWLPDLDHYIFMDIEFADDSNIYVAYQKFDAPFGRWLPGGSVESYGVLHGEYRLDIENNPYDPYERAEEHYWLWTDVSTNLPDRTAGGGSCYISDLQFNDYDGDKLFAAVSRNSSWGGGVHVFDLDGGYQWETVISGDPSLSAIRDFRALAQSTDGSVLYAGSRGHSSGTGSLIRCNDVSDLAFGGWNDATDSWEALINDPVQTAPNATNFFGLHENNPYWEFDYTLIGDSEHGTQYGLDQNIDKKLIYIGSLAVDPRHSDVVYIGVSRSGFSKTEGVWRFDSNNGTCWNQSLGTEIEGQSIDCMGFNPHVEGQLCFGTNGRGFYFNGIVPVDPPDPPYDPNDVPIEARTAIFGDSKPTCALENGQTALRFSLLQSADLEMEIFDVQGRLVRRIDRKNVQAGIQSIAWNGKNERGNRAASGVYFARLRAGSESRTGELVLLR